MASSSLLRNRTLRTLSSFNRLFSASSLTSAPPLSVPIDRAISPTPSSQSPSRLVQSRAFRSSSTSFLSARPSFNNNSDEIGPDTILFEGCDYNHWLIVMDFPKDPRPSPEQMVETYVQTCAKGLNISIEEAKKKIYACSTTTYTGFQAVVTEEESEKFNGLPGVIFVLPDSYIDPVNKEYGGDKYINGTIIPRPPPIQYGRSQGRRDRSRNPDQPRYNRQGNPMSNQPGSPSYNNQGSMQGDGRNYGASQNYPPQQNYGPASQNYPPQQNYGPASQNYPPQQNYSPGSQNYPPQQNYGPASHNYPSQQNYGPASDNYPPQQNYGTTEQNYAPQQNYGPASQNFSQPQSYGSASHQYGAQKNYTPASPQYAPPQNFGPLGQVESRITMPTQGGIGSYPSHSVDFKQVAQEQGGFQQRYPPPDSSNLTGDQRRNFGSSGQGERRNTVPTQGGTDVYQSQFREFTPTYKESFTPSYMEEFKQLPQEQGGGSQQRYPPSDLSNLTGDKWQNFGPSGQGERRNTVPTQGGTDAYKSQLGEFTPEEFKQAAQELEGRPQLPGQGNLNGDYGTYNFGHRETYVQGGYSGYRQNFSGHGLGERFTQGEQRDAEGGQRSYAPLGRTGTEQGRY